MARPEDFKRVIIKLEDLKRTTPQVRGVLIGAGNREEIGHMSKILGVCAKHVEVDHSIIPTHLGVEDSQEGAYQASRKLSIMSKDLELSLASRTPHVRGETPEVRERNEAWMEHAIAVVNEDGREALRSGLPEEALRFAGQLADRIVVPVAAV